MEQNLFQQYAVWFTQYVLIKDGNIRFLKNNLIKSFCVLNIYRPILQPLTKTPYVYEKDVAAPQSQQVHGLRLTFAQTCL